MKDKEYIEMLKKRDTAMAVGRYKPVTKDMSPWDICPVCGRLILTNDAQFCALCGQRLDRENYRFE